MARILVMGLPGSGKTTLAQKLAEMIVAKRINADEVRARFNDWDFSIEGRLRQAQRIRQLADEHELVVADFVCPLSEMRDVFDAHFTIWMDTIGVGRYEDTNKMFVPPEKFDCRVTNWDAKWLESISNKIKSML
jgi:adenylylsulfate kinase